MQKIILIEQDKRDAVKYGKLMFEHKKRLGFSNSAIGKKHSPLYYDILGVAGEIAVYKYFGIPYTFQLHEVRDKYDLMIGQLKVDIKCTEVELLKINPKQIDNDINIYIQVVAKKEEYNIIGWMFKKAFQKVCYSKNGWLFVDDKELRPIEDLKTFYENL